MRYAVCSGDDTPYTMQYAVFSGDLYYLYHTIRSIFGGDTPYTMQYAVFSGGYGPYTMQYAVFSVVDTIYTIQYAVFSGAILLILCNTQYF